MFYAFHCQMKKMLGQLDGWLGAAADNAKARGFDPNVLVESRLAPDQFSFVRQVQAACDTAKLATLPPHREGRPEPSRYRDDARRAAGANSLRDRASRGRLRGGLCRRRDPRHHDAALGRQGHERRRLFHGARRCRTSSSTSRTRTRCSATTGSPVGEARLPRRPDAPRPRYAEERPSASSLQPPPGIFSCSGCRIRRARAVADDQQLGGRQRWRNDINFVHAELAPVSGL